jgi:hypothetical protein
LEHVKWKIIKDRYATYRDNPEYQKYKYTITGLGKEGTPNGLASSLQGQTNNSNSCFPRRAKPSQKIFLC